MSAIQWGSFSLELLGTALFAVCLALLDNSTNVLAVGSGRTRWLNGKWWLSSTAIIAFVKNQRKGLKKRKYGVEMRKWKSRQRIGEMKEGWEVMIQASSERTLHSYAHVMPSCNFTLIFKCYPPQKEDFRAQRISVRTLNHFEDDRWELNA